MEKQEIKSFFEKNDLEHSLLIGFYGGGNYGDELLLETLLNEFSRKEYKHIRIYYQAPEVYTRFHHNFGYEVLDARNKPKFLRESLKSKHVIVGGGGLWGMDVNPNILLLSILLLIYRYIFRKKVYLLGVGYYGSTGKLGKLSAFLAAKAANKIIARDREAAQRFKRFTRRVVLGNDIAWLLKDMPLDAYQNDTEALEKSIAPAGKTLFIAIRHFKPTHKNNFVDIVETFLAQNQSKPVIVAMLQTPESYPEGHKLLETWQKRYPNVQMTNGMYNPLALFLFLQRHKQNLAIIAPQFHLIISAYLNSVPFLPVAYDNKVTELLEQIDAPQIIPINELEQFDIQQFADIFFEQRSRAI
jgi:polysaccharide pyruvyl transferase WcaK-like protein